MKQKMKIYLQFCGFLCMVRTEILKYFLLKFDNMNSPCVFNTDSVFTGIICILKYLTESE